MIYDVTLCEVIGKLAESGMPSTAIEAFQTECSDRSYCL